MRPRRRARRHAPGPDEHDEAVVFALAGELDVGGVHALAGLHREAMRGPEPCIVVDLTETTFVDVTIARLLGAAARQAAARGGRVALACRHPTVLRVLRLVEAERAARICRDVPEALRSLHAVPGRLEHVRG